MTDESYIFDTYALIEIIRGNENYKTYANAKIVITDFILAELCFNLIRELGIAKSYYYVDEYAPFVYKIDKEVIKEAMHFRYLNKKKDLSMADCIGHILAKRLGIKFLTGDKEFKSLENVEFVK